ncbi:hypothetical protein [Nocardia nepalensis]|uniref:hypothetical protein n=1 Tax=Nocardia nepalensis TaxID=3375448 RepID=UPI003B6827F6
MHAAAAFLRALWGAIVALSTGWAGALIALIRLLQAMIQAACDRARLPGRTARTADSRCVPIKHPAYRKPDPLIYSQQYLMDLGLAVTWDNPDIELRRGGVAVPSSDIAADTDYDIVARIWNGSANAPVVGLAVEFHYLDFGIGTTPIPIGTTTVDLGVKGGPNCPAMAVIPWRTPPRPGHYCLQVRFSWIDDANPLNNIGQENLTVVAAHSPAEFGFRLRNPDAAPRVFVFATDTYRLPPPLSCNAVERPTKRELRRRAVGPADARLFPELPASVRAHHDPAAHPVPDDWQLCFHPARIALDPDAEVDIQVVATPPDGFTGTKRFNIRAVADELIAGGITVDIEAR